MLLEPSSILLSCFFSLNALASHFPSVSCTVPRHCRPGVASPVEKVSVLCSQQGAPDCHQTVHIEGRTRLDGGFVPPHLPFPSPVHLSHLCVDETQVVSDGGMQRKCRYHGYFNCSPTCNLVKKKKENATKSVLTDCP